MLTVSSRLIAEHIAPAGQRFAFARPARTLIFYPLLVMGLAFMLLFAALVLTRMQMEVRRRALIRQGARHV